jgi:hypothetical protein
LGAGQEQIFRQAGIRLRRILLARARKEKKGEGGTRIVVIAALFKIKN